MQVNDLPAITTQTSLKLFHFIKGDQKKMKKKIWCRKMIQGNSLSFLPQISRFNHSGPAQYDKLQINSKFRMLVASMVLITSASVIYLLQAASSPPPVPPRVPG